MKRILLMGNPNVGKSAVFSRLTGVHVIASNYPGTTVEFTKGDVNIGDEEAVLIDVPGTYGLEATCKAEDIACRMVKDGDLIINVVDATNIERNLHLTSHLLEQNIPVIIALNIWDEAKHKGINIDVAKMEKLLGVPVVPTVGISGEGFKELMERIPEAAAPSIKERSEEERWVDVGKIVEQIQQIEHRHHTFLERLGDASIIPVTGIPIAAIAMVMTFMIVRFIAENLISYVLEPVFFNIWQPFMMKISTMLTPGTLIHSIVIGNLIDGQIDFIQSFGMLTTGLFVPLAMVFPYIVSFYLVLGFLEDFGYLPRLAVLLDNVMHKMGLHGWAIIPSLLGFGCNVSGIMATRTLEDRREKLIAATIISIGVPCAALQAMIWGLLGKHGGIYICIVYFSLFLSWLILGRVLNLVLKGHSPELVMEVPPYRFPSVKVLAKKLQLRVLWFLKEALPIVLAGVFLVNMLYYFRVFDLIANIFAPIVTKVWGLPKEAVVALAIGFLRKDVAVGMLGTLNLTAGQLTVACTVLSMFFPCIATFAVLAKELGVKDTAISILTMLISSIITGGILNSFL